SGQQKYRETHVCRSLEDRPAGGKNRPRSAQLRRQSLVYRMNRLESEVMMRLRTIALASVLVPVALSAQIRRPRITTRPAPPTAVPKQPNAIRQWQAYQRSKFYTESYPVAAYSTSSAYPQSGVNYGEGFR